MQHLPLSSLAWQFRDTTDKAWLPAQIPGCVHTDLLAAGKIEDPFWGENEAAVQWIEERDWEYRATFAVTAQLLAEEVVELVADGLDTVATVYLNDKKIAATENMFVAHRWNVKRHLRRGRNELRIVFGSAMRYIRGRRRDHTPRELNDPVGGCTRIRKQQCQFGWDWGPRFVTAGIWRDLRLEGWTGNRIESVRITQQHGRRNGAVLLDLIPELARPDPDATCRYAVSLDGETVAEGRGRRVEISNPHLWWPNGQGEQPLYEVMVEVVASSGQPIGTWTRRIGLRTIVLDRHKDTWGESFQFVVNGRPVFAKGANWIPAHTFVAALERADYARDLDAAAAAHMNMVRVWGGGIYESEDFYDLCDELGLLVWQDFMFACTLYPADEPFLASVREEVAHQAARLRHRACLALWCGNNEVYMCNANELAGSAGKALREQYESLFHEAVPGALAAVDPVTSFWPSSPWRGTREGDHLTGEKQGDTHYWDVWHGRFPVKDYERWSFRFASEFGMQSYASPTTQATFCPEDDGNVFGPSMENHQKNRGGNQVILDYVSRRYRFPRSQEALIYLSQLNQAHCMQVGVEHYRRAMPRCMGALYWQLNDCWPVASWSSIEFTGRWKALHYLARRFNAPLLVTAHVPGDEVAGIGNYRTSTVAEVNLYTVSDDPEERRGLMRWSLVHLDGRTLRSGKKKVVLRCGESVRQERLDLTPQLERFGRENVYLRLALDVDGACVSEDTVLLTLPRFLALTPANTYVSLDDGAEGEVMVTLRSDAFQHRVWLDLPGIDFIASDNCFDLYPEEARVIRLHGAKSLTKRVVEKNLKMMSVADTY